MKISDVLLAEHGLLRAMMEAMSDWLVEPLPAESLRERAIMLGLALESHAQREERELFAPLRPLSAGARHLVDMMELVHDEIRGLYDEIAEGADPTERLWTILELSEHHFREEEEQLFPLADEFLPG